MQASWLIAVLLAAMASFISNLGVTLQKLHHLRSAAADAVMKSTSSANSEDYHKGWMWRVGLGLVFFGSLADFAALSFGPQSLVAPLGSLTLVSNVIFAPLLLKETIGHWDVLATVLIVLGSSVAVIFGSHEAVTYTVWQLFGFFTRWDFILYALVMTIYGGLLYLAIQKIERIEREEGVHSPRYLHYRALHRFAYPSLSGTVGAQSVLFAKAFVELLATTARHWQHDGFAEEESLPLPYPTSAAGGNSTDALPSSLDLPPPVHYDRVSQNMFLYWQTYFVFFSMLGAIFAQIKYLNDGLRRFDASYSVPVFTSFWIILSVVSGMIFYREYRGMDTAQCMLFALGVAITVTGVITLGGREQAHSATHQSLPTEEETEESPDGGEHVRQDGSLNPSDDKYAHSHTPVIRPHSARNGSKGDASHHGAHILPVTEDNLELDLDLDGDLLDESLHHHEPSSASGSAASSSHPGHVSTLGSTNNDEASVADGAKTVVIEASQRISQAFSRLRGKGGDPHFPVSAVASSPYASSIVGRGSDSLHIPAASSNHAVIRTRADSAHHDESAEVSAAEEDHVADHAADPLIQALKGSSSSSSSSGGANSTRKSPASGHGMNAQQQQAAIDAHFSSQPPPMRERALSTTPTAQALYDPTPSPHADSVARTFHHTAAAAAPDYTVGAQRRSPKAS